MCTEMIMMKVEIILLGLYLLGMTAGILYYCFKERKLSSFITGIVAILLFCGLPAWGFYINTNKYCSKPKPTNKTEICINGKNCILYQDATHHCHASDRHSKMFTSLLLPNGKTSQKDICIHCGKSFLHHDTHVEQRYYSAMEYLAFSENF